MDSQPGPNEEKASRVPLDPVYAPLIRHPIRLRSKSIPSPSPKRVDIPPSGAP